MDMLVFIKGVEWLLMAAYALSMTRSLMLGLSLSESRQSGLPYGFDLTKKMQWAGRSYLLLWLLIGWSLFLRSKETPDIVLIWMHLPFAILSLFLATTIAFRKNGIKDQKNHKSFAFAYIASASLMLLTGALLMLSLE